MARRPCRFFLGEPITGHGFKGSGLLLFYGCNSRLGFLALVTGVNTLFKKLFRLFATFSRIFQADSRVGAKGYAFFLALKAILETPPLAPVGGQLRDRGHRCQTEIGRQFRTPC